MIIEQFIEKARGGGWEPNKRHDYVVGKIKSFNTPIEVVLLDPLAWQAVGKVDGWNENKGMITMYKYDGVSKNPTEIKRTDFPIWKVEMHRMIDALAEGKSIKGFLKTL